jgi:hypothetical protein
VIVAAQITLLLIVVAALGVAWGPLASIVAAGLLGALLLEVWDSR